MTRNYSIDILKFTCAILIVFLHTKSTYQDAILPLTRCAVPCFMMISGYLLYKEGGIGQERLNRNLWHVIKLTVWSTLLYVVWKEFLYISKGGFIPRLNEIFDWIFFNECPFGYHLWYLYAYIYVLLIVKGIEKYGNWKLLFISIPFLLFTDLAFGKYSMVIFGREFPYIFVRNFMFVGLPYFALGAFLKSNDNLITINKYALLGGVIVFSITSQLEKYFLIYINKCSPREHYISSTFLALCLFLFVLSFSVKRPSLISQIGEKDSLYIYIFHPIFITSFTIVSNKLGFSGIYSYIAPFVVLAATYILIRMLRRIKIIK